MVIPHDLPKLDDQWVLNIWKVDLHFSSFCYLSARQACMSYIVLSFLVLFVHQLVNDNGLKMV